MRLEAGEEQMAETYSYTKNYLTKDGQPWFPVMGEFHFSRYPQQYWKESLYKMKAGGVDIVSSYVIWIHHEEAEGEFDFTGQRDLRAFVQTVKECGLKMFLRIGPWCHGEVRNGGFPDWLLKKEFEPRTNNALYFREVRRFYLEIERQTRGLFHKDGGPIIGIQIENEYGHCGGLKGDEGEVHMRHLTEMAREVGLLTPLYTATGWGGAVTGGLLPVMGGYCEAPWDQRITELEPNENYIFTNERNDSSIGSDYGKKLTITFDMREFPYLTAELGGGLQVTHHRRPVARAKDIGAMSLAKLGSGVTLLGYYMYHGGTNPRGKLSTLQESRATGYLNDLPEFSYDFHAPIREYGQMTETLNEIKLLAMFLKDFGSELCEMDTYLTSEQRPEDFQELRTSLRRKGRQGYLFVNNYQRRYRMALHLGKVLEAEAEGERITYSPMDIQDGDYFFLPFHMPVGDGELKSACVTPLCKIRGGDNQTYVFYGDRIPLYEWERKPSSAELLTITRKQALNAWKLSLDTGKREHLVITEDKIIPSDCGYDILVRKNAELLSYPALPLVPEGYCCEGKREKFTLYRRVSEIPWAEVRWHLSHKKESSRIYEILLKYPPGIDDCFLLIDFAGDLGRMWINGTAEADWFYTGETWEIGMKRFGFPERIEIEIEPLLESAEVFLEKRPVFVNGVACEIQSVSVETECKSSLI